MRYSARHAQSIGHPIACRLDHDDLSNMGLGQVGIAVDEERRQRGAGNQRQSFSLGHVQP
jgi:hypothetical protein